MLVGPYAQDSSNLMSSLKATNNDVETASPTQSTQNLNDLTAEERIAKVFGGRIKGDDRVSSSRIMMGEPRIIAGVKVPDKPIEPDNCCMSGCINCVWEIYNDDIKDWELKRKLAAEKLANNGGIWPADFDPPVRLLKPENLPEAFKDKSNVTKNDEDAVWNRVPVEMRVFAELEKKIKGKKPQAAQP